MNNSLALTIVLFLILWAEFVNGWTDAPNAITTVVATKVLKPSSAILMAAFFNVLGAFSGIKVAETIGKGIIKTELINFQTVGAAMIGIIIWSTLAWRRGLPTSETHGLIAGLTGAGLAIGGREVILIDGWIKIFFGLLFSTFLGFFLAFIIFSLMTKIFYNFGISKIRKIFGKLQIFSAAFMAFSHGSNDGQKFMGAFTLALFLAGEIPSFIIPYWVIFLCAAVMGIGTAFGGWRIIKTLGLRLTRLEPQQGFAAETAAASAIELASRLGIPLSTTHTISTAIMGVGAVQRRQGIRWFVAKDIVLAWLLTFPVCGLISFIITKLII